jgi:aspartyl-tRNA(Asn)/glutamyl-tRNA(Gln) amidotransferase subunit B
LEIVSHPDMATPEEAKAYLEEIRLLLRELAVSDCEMQEGSLRCDANINIHVPQSSNTFIATPIIEVKNLNSFRGVERALKFEADRQYKEFVDAFGKEWQALGEPKDFKFSPQSGLTDSRRVDHVAANGKPVAKATAGWNDDRGTTVVQRRKEEAADYRYFPEPDLVPVVVEAAQLDQIRAGLGELPAAQRQRLQTQYSLSTYDAEVLSRQGRPLVAYFEEAVRHSGDAAEVKNWLANDVLQTLNERKIDIQAFPIKAASLGELIKEVKTTGLNKQRAREVYAEMLASGSSAKDAIAKLGIKVVADEGQLREIVRRAIAANAKAVADFKNGKLKAADAIKGAVMRETKGQAKTELVQKILMEELAKA